MFLTRGLIVISAISMTAPVDAQVFDMGALTATLSIDHVTQSEEDKGSQETHPTTPATSGTQRASILSYTVSQSRRQNNQKRFLSSMGVGEEASQIDFVEQVDKAMRPMGLRADNVADALAVWWIASWKAVNRKKVEEDVTLYAAVKRQASNKMMRLTFLSSANDAQKQEMAEYFLMQALSINAKIEAASGNAIQQVELSKVINQDAKARGLDLTAMDLTEQGFVPHNR